MTTNARILALIAGVALGTPLAANAQTAAAPASSPTTVTYASSGVPQRDTLMRMTRPLSANFQEQRLEDVMKFVAEVTGADLEPMWQDDRNPVGLNKDTLITLNVQNRQALQVVEQIMEHATDSSSGTGGNSWQMSDSGAMQIGPKERLNKFKRVEIYAINDLLLDLPQFNNAPQFDLQSTLQSSQGGGGSQSPFQQNSQNDSPRKSHEEKAMDIIQLITTLIDPDQWQDGGGDATIRFFQGSLIVNAPDYMHRQLVGYPYWSARATKVAMVNGRRWVGFNAETASSQLRELRNVPITGP